MDQQERDKLAQIRAQIDDLDTRILGLVSERAMAAKEVARIKLATGNDRVYYRPEREVEVLRRVQEENNGPLSNETVAILFREIMSACLALQQPLKIAFLGPAGTFTQQAVLRHFGQSVHTVSLPAIGEVFREVESDAAHYGVVPIENSTEGVISHTLDRFVRSPLQICGEVELRIHHHLMGTMKALGELQRVCSHQQSLAQCREWLDRNLPGIERVPVSSNAEAARLASHSQGVAAIAGTIAAETYGLDVLVSNIEDEPNNTTRFLVVGNQQVLPTACDKTTFLISGKNQPGALHRLLQPLAENGISMTRIESRPSHQGMWDYIFFVDIEGHAKDEKVAKTLALLAKEASMYKLLGSYPCAVL